MHLVERWRELLRHMDLYYLRLLEDAIEKEAEINSKGELTAEDKLTLIYIEVVKRIVAEELRVNYNSSLGLDVDESLLSKLGAYAEPV
ncbi:hypothetical protein TCELL_0862 [Thermogladius calderae 1633]|uniref:Uncharacterized protein n=2 Tax=Thermogladius calderae TaxID=1200300 RepID=I3TEU8_THEC1|nr:hypothetical protein TCELL_0862 [Thermogladius calderae 1633]